MVQKVLCTAVSTRTVTAVPIVCMSVVYSCVYCIQLYLLYTYVCCVQLSMTWRTICGRPHGGELEVHGRRHPQQVRPRVLALRRPGSARV